MPQSIVCAGVALEQKNAILLPSLIKALDRTSKKPTQGHRFRLLGLSYQFSLVADSFRFWVHQKVSEQQCPMCRAVSKI